MPREGQIKEIDWNTLNGCVQIQCTGEECASVLNIDYDTLNARIKEKYGYGFSDYFRKKSGKGKASLRRRQFEMAKNNPTMAIWLGKNMLGQVDTPLIDQSKHDHYTVVFRVDGEDSIQTPQESGNRLEGQLEV